MRPVYLLSDSEVEDAISLPMLYVRFHSPALNLENMDALIVTSKNAVNAVNEITPYWTNLPVYAVGPATAKTVKNLGGKIAYISESRRGEGFAMELSKFIHDRKFLYLRAKEVAHDLKETLERMKMSIEERIVYETRAIEYAPEAAPPDDSVIIFTSPSTIEAFMSNFAWNETYTAVAIGPTTAWAMPCLIPYKLSPDPSFEIAVRYARALA